MTKLYGVWLEVAATVNLNGSSQINRSILNKLTHSSTKVFPKQNQLHRCLQSSNICLEDPAEKGGKNVQRVVQEQVRVSRYLVRSIYMKDTFDNQPRTNLRRGLLQKAVTTRGRCVAHMLFWSCRDMRRPRHLLNAKNTAIVQSHPDGTTKNKISYFGDPQTGVVYTY